MKGELPSRRYKAVHHHQYGLSDLSLCLHSALTTCQSRAEQLRLPVKVRTVMALLHCLEGSVSLVSLRVPLKSNPGFLLPQCWGRDPANMLITLCCEHSSTVISQQHPRSQPTTCMWFYLARVKSTHPSSAFHRHWQLE